MASHPYQPPQPGDQVKFHLSPGIVTASYFVSLTGTFTTVELLQRRTYVKGWANWFQLGSCAVTMGLIGIWCMHYTGNRAIIMANGEKDLQLIYNPGFTALSSFIPAITLFVAFLVADRRYRGRKSLLASLILSGVVAGMAIVGMHYTGNMGISNYHVHFKLDTVGGAIVIACLVCVCGLTLIFLLQELWLNALPWRILGAVVLAGGVSGMHFEASMGTSYILKHRTSNPSSRNTNFITATVLCLLTIPICVGITVSASKRRRQLADRAQQVALACVRFDPEGRLMVTHEGLLPFQKITVDRNEKSFQDEFNVTHPVFQWIFRVSHNWSSISRFLPSMRRHLQAAKFLNETESQKDMETKSTSDSISALPTDDYSLLFREAFCVAASDLANGLKEDVMDLGTLYENVMMTGTSTTASSLQRRSSLRRQIGLGTSPTDGEAEPGNPTDVFGKGQLLLLISQCSKSNASQMALNGYRFAPIETIADHLAKRMRVPISYLIAHLHNLKKSACSNRCNAPAGTLLGCFAIRAGVSKTKWDVLVRKDCPDKLPCVQLSEFPLTAREVSIVSQLDGLSTSRCISRLIQLSKDPKYSTSFPDVMKDKIEKLAEVVDEPYFQQAIFSSRAVGLPASGDGEDSQTYRKLLVFNIIPDVHSSLLTSSRGLIYKPLSFFQCQQQTIKGAPQHGSFDRQVHHEFAALFPAAKEGPSSFSISTSESGADEATHLPAEPNLTKPKAIFAYFRNLVNYRQKRIRLKDQEQDAVRCISRSEMPYGGIMVSHDLTVETSHHHPQRDELGYWNPGIKSYAGLAEEEIPTFVDELYAIAAGRWQSEERSPVGLPKAHGSYATAIV